jgi:histidyl-tRNA synthetase
VTVTKTSKLSGFPEWLPDGQLVQQLVEDTARRVFELYGYAPVETRSVEPLEQMLRKGEIDKEVYLLRRLHAAENEQDPGLGLHFDLTVPFARYVLENSGRLEFPFRRYQIQKVWRGERPQEGRFREFTQADIDVIGRDTLAFHHEVEMAVVMATVLADLPIPTALVQVNNRKLAEGFFRGVGADDPNIVLRAIDKIDKIGPEKVRALLTEEAGLSEAGAAACLALAEIRTPDASFVDRVRALGVRNDLLDQGLDELVRVVEGANAQIPGSVVADLRIARGLDYYTGTVYETELAGFESVGSIASGGRYDSLASDGRQTFPGVGISLGVTRLVAILLGRDLVSVSRSVPSVVLVAVVDEESRRDSEGVAARLRARGIPCEVSPDAAKFGKQIKHADRRGIPYVWFAEPSGDTIKDIRTGEQVPADADSWSPHVSELHPIVTSTLALEARQ